MPFSRTRTLLEQLEDQSRRLESQTDLLVTSLGIVRHRQDVIIEGQERLFNLLSSQQRDLDYLKQLMSAIPVAAPVAPVEPSSPVYQPTSPPYLPTNFQPSSPLRPLPESLTPESPSSPPVSSPLSPSDWECLGTWIEGDNNDWVPLDSVFESSDSDDPAPTNRRRRRDDDDDSSDEPPARVRRLA